MSPFVHIIICCVILIFTISLKKQPKSVSIYEFFSDSQKESYTNTNTNTNANKITTAIAVNDLKYGSFNQVDLDLTQNHIIKSFPLPLPLYDLQPSTKNLSVETLKELDFILEMSNGVTNKQKISVDKYEKDIFGEFILYCKTNRLLYDLPYLERVRDDIKCLCYQLKFIYNRPRPYQLGYYVGRLIIPRPVINSSTPSYPSYSTLLSKTLANVLSYNNPGNANDLQTIAKEVELSRLLGGFNYPSDNKASIEIASIVKKYIKYYEKLK